MVYPFFKPLVDEITEVIQTKDIDNLMDFFAAAISILVSVGFAAIKVRGIAQSDIKNDKIKVALLHANLYFNTDGKLVKKTEKMLKKDLNGDGIIDDGEASVTSPGLFSGIITAIKEFRIITQADLSGDEKENEKVFIETLEETELSESKEALDEIEETIFEGISKIAVEKTTEKIDKKIEKTDKSKKLTEEQKFVSKFGLTAMKNKLTSVFSKKKKNNEVKDQIEVLQNNIEKDAAIKSDKKVVKEKIVETKEVQKTQNSTAILQQPQTKTTIDSDIFSYLTKMKT